MSLPRRLTGTLASLLGTLLQLNVIAATMPRWQECGAAGLCVIEHSPPDIIHLAWRPFIDPAGDGARGLFDGPYCPDAAPAGAATIVAAPLPAGYDPHAYPDRSMFACVRLDGRGGVAAVRLLSGTGQAGVDRALVGWIARAWRFSAEGRATAGWHRVRLNSGRPDPGAVWLSL